MTTREHKLALILLIILVGAGGFLLAKMYYLDPAQALEAQLKDHEKKLEQRDKDLAAENEKIKEIVRVNPRLAKWEKLSLPAPDSPNPSPEALKSHYARLRGDYQKELEKLLEKSGFVLGPIKWDNVEQQRTSSPIRAKTPLYTAFSLKFEGESDLQALVKVFEGFYRLPLLHQIRSFEANPIASKSTGGKTALFTKMDIEVLMVEGAERLDKKDQKGESKRPGLLPVFTGKGDDKAPVMLAGGRKYEDIARKNIFAPPARIVRDIPTPPETPRENSDDVFSFIRLTAVTFSDYYGIWTARMINPGTRGVESVLLSAGPLPADCRYLQRLKELEKRVEEKKKAEERLRKGNLNGKETTALAELVSKGDDAEVALKTLEKPVSKWTIKDKFKETLAELQIVRIDEKGVVFQSNGDLYAIYLSDMTLMDALDQKLDKAQIKELGLGGDRDTTLKKVELTKIEFKKDRKTYEGHFINPSYKNEKMVMSTEALPEEEFAPEDWKVRDGFGAEVIKLTALKMEKERIIFGVKGEKKFYAIKVGGNLADAMAKALSDAEAKELKLEAP